MFRKILIANRGEIAVRVIKACREMGIASVAVFSEADADALHVRLADEAVPPGPPPAAESHLHMGKIVAAARAAGGFGAAAGARGYPVMVKASAGGGGKGMRIVPDEDGLEPALEAGRREA